MPETSPSRAKPGIGQLLIQSALEPDLCRRLLESPDQMFQDFDLTEEEKDVLRKPDHRLLPLLGAALSGQSATGPSQEEPTGPQPILPVIEARTLPAQLLALTVVPCVLRASEQQKGIAYAVWVSPLAEGADPASLPPPAGAVLPGPPLAPLYAVIQLSAVQSLDATGNLQVGLWASFRQSSNVIPPPPPETAGNSEALGSRADSAPVADAAAAVRHATGSERYDRLVDLLRVVRAGDVP